MPLAFGPMDSLPAEQVEYVFVHSAAWPGDVSAEEIHRDHKAPKSKGGRGWAGIGYHFVIRKSGRLEVGRPVDKQGAHVRGLNDRSLGVVLSGNGDTEAPTLPQFATLIRLLSALSLIYGVPPERILGHREVGTVEPKWRTDKSCPGRRVSMEAVRNSVRAHLSPEDPGTPPIRRAA